MPAKLTELFHEFVKLIEQIATIYLYEAKFDPALTLLSAETIGLLKGEIKPNEWARLQILQAGIIRYKGYCDYDPTQYDEAINILKDVIHLVEEPGEKALLADAVDLTGLALQSKEGSREASFGTRLGYFERALEIRKEIGDQRGLAESYLHVGMVYQNRRPPTEDDVKKAYEAFQKSYDIAAEGNFASEKAHAARHLAYIFDGRNEPEMAFKLHQEFLKTNQAVGFKPYLAPAHVMVGLAYFKCGELAEAEQHCRTAYDIATEINSNHFLADANLMLGIIAVAYGGKGKALKHFKEALSLAKMIDLTRVINLANREIEKMSGNE